MTMTKDCRPHRTSTEAVVSDSIRYTLIAIALMAGAGPGSAEEPPASPVLPRVEGGLSSTERRGSPLETLESLVGEVNRESDEIETDRDSFTPATSTTPRGRFIL